MRVVHLAAGAAGMYCGSCMHDNRLAAALIEQGHDIVLVPLYTPIRTDETDVSGHRVYYGGINVCLQQVSAVFRHTPWIVDRLFDARGLLGAVGRFAASTKPEALGELTRSVLRGNEGPQRKELAKLIAGLRELKPGLIHLPNLMFVGIAGALKSALGVPVLCNLAGEDIFLDKLVEPYRAEVFALIRQHAPSVDGFVALTDYYAGHASKHFALPADRVHRIPLGIRVDDFSEPAAPPATPFTIGYLAHVFPPKGLAELAAAFALLRKAGRDCRLRAAGYLGPADRTYLEDVRHQLQADGAADAFEYVGEVTRRQKVDFLRTLHVFSVPATYPESKGFYVLEALAAGVPVVAPAHGAFPELIASTEGGLLFEPGDTQALAEKLALLMDVNDQRRDLAVRGRAAVRTRHSAAHVAAEAWKLYARFL